MTTQFDPKHIQNAIWHSIGRARERYSMWLTEFDIFRISDEVMKGKGILKIRQSDRSIYKLNYMGKNFVLVFDYVLQVVVTFLPHKALKKYSHLSHYFSEGGLYV